MKRHFQYVWVLFLVFALSSTLPANAQVFQHRIGITVAGNPVVGGPHINFPVILTLPGSPLSEFRTVANGGKVESNQGYDISFFIGGERLNHEIVEYNPSTGQYSAWINIPSLDNSTRMDILFGSTDVTTNPSSSDTWKSEFAAVWHFDQTADLSFTDESANNNDVVLNDNTQDVSGQLFRSRFFAGSDYIDMGNPTEVNPTTHLSASAWVQRFTTGSTHHIFSKGASFTNTNGYAMYIFDNGFDPPTLRVELQNTATGEETIAIANYPNDLDFHHVGFSWDASVDGGEISVFIDGVKQSIFPSPTFAGPIGTTSQDLWIGGNSSLSDRRFFGKIDEVKLYDGYLNEDWFETSYANQTNPVFFFSFGSSSFGTFPVEYLSFQAEIIEEGVALSWVTASETNNNFFTLERSNDAVLFEPLTVVSGAGNSTIPLSYQAIDVQPLRREVYYRLKQTDFDGSFSYSDVIRFSFEEGNEKVTIAVGAANSRSISVNLSGFKGSEPLDVSVLDLSAREVYHQKVFLNDLGVLAMNISLNDQLSPGVYFVAVRSRNTVTGKQIIIR